MKTSPPTARRVYGLVAAALAFTACTSGAAPQGPHLLPPAGREFRIDAGHSTVEFEIPFLHDRVRGTFDDVRGSVYLAEPGTPGRSSRVMTVIRVASIHTGSAHRDEHLRSDDFFDADHDSLVVFRGEAHDVSARGFLLSGTLAMHGRTRPVRIPCRLTLPPTRDPHHVVVAGASGTTTLARRDFGILGGAAHNPWFDALRSATMGDSVRITLDVHLWAPDLDDPDSTCLLQLAAIDRIGIDSALVRLEAVHARDSTRLAGAWFTLDEVGSVLIHRGRIAEGCAWLETLARLLPGSADAQASAGAARAAQGDEAGAASWFARALAADSLNGRVAVRWEVPGAGTRLRR